MDKRSSDFHKALADIRLAKTTAPIKKRTKCPQCDKLYTTKNFHKHLRFHERKAKALKDKDLIKLEENELKEEDEPKEG